MEPPFDWETGEPNLAYVYAESTQRALFWSAIGMVALLFVLALVFSASFVVIPMMPVLGGIMLFGSIIGLSIFIAVFG